MTRPAGAKWTNTIVAVLIHVLRTAQMWEIIDRVPRVRPLKVPPQDFDHLDQADQDRLVETARLGQDPWLR